MEQEQRLEQVNEAEEDEAAVSNNSNNDEAEGASDGKMAATELT